MNVLRYQVYDVTNYVTVHPGGMAILKNAGEDATEGFTKQPAHRVVKTHIASLLETFYVGSVLSEKHDKKDANRYGEPRLNK